jgi:hypothetical protein
MLASFRLDKRELELKVRRGDLTTKVARQQAAMLASDVATKLRAQVETFSRVPRVFLDRLTDVANRRRGRTERSSLENLQRETNRLLQSMLLEQQIQARTAEFESRTYVRPIAGGEPAPSLETLLAHNRSSKLAGDDPAVEWSIRRLEDMRPFLTNDDDHRRVDLATDQPHRINPRLIEKYLDTMRGKPADALEEFANEAVTARDSNACIAAFILARESPDALRLRWVRTLLEKIDEYPDGALNTLRHLEVKQRDADRKAALSHIETVGAQAVSEARMFSAETPSDEELERRAAIEKLPVAKLGEPIGLALDRRGALDGEEIDPPA